MPTRAIEEYLESIYKLQARGIRVIGARLVEELGVSAPTVTEMIRRLRQEGFISLSDDKEVSLTAEGVAAAEILIRRHRLSERLFTDILGMSWTQAHEEACKFEHVISPEVEEGLARALNYPSTCPHGNPIPGEDEASEQLHRLSEARVGSRVVIRCIDLEDQEMLDYVESLGLLPGAELEVAGFAPLGGPVEVRVGTGEGSVFVGLVAAERLLVRQLDEAAT